MFQLFVESRITHALFPAMWLTYGPSFVGFIDSFVLDARGILLLLANLRYSGGHMFNANSIQTDHKDLVHDVAYDFYGKRFATCSSDQTVKVR